MKKPVLGLFENEDELRDEIYNNLSDIEDGLTGIAKNYPVHNANGANGSLDILARDDYGNFVIIEVKRSDAAARQALHELSKYISLFLEDQQVDYHKIRCFVISTDWHELDVSLSYFCGTVDVDTKGFVVTANNGKIEFSKRDLPPIDLLPKLCPDYRFLFFENQEAMIESARALEEKTKNFEEFRAALLPLSVNLNSPEDIRAILCAWRIRDANLQACAKLMGIAEDNFVDSYYQGWEAEFSLLGWLMDQCDHVRPEFTEPTIATSEKIYSLLEHRDTCGLFKLGEWPKKDLINDETEIKRCLLAKDVSSVGRRANRHSFEAKSSPVAGKSWDYIKSSFIEFISRSNSNIWGGNAADFLAGIPDDCSVEFFASDCRHIEHRIYQRLHNKKIELSNFSILVKDRSRKLIRGFSGEWAWDGVTFPDDAEEIIRHTYESDGWLKFSLFSAVDENRYELSYYILGFYPIVKNYNFETTPKTYSMIVPDQSPPDFDGSLGLGDFIENNEKYCEQILSIFENFPTGLSEEIKPD